MHRGVIVAARLLSYVFRPYWFPVMGFVALFLFTYLRLLPLSYKATVVAMVYVFTVLLPRLCVFAWRRFCGLSAIQLRKREQRAVPYSLFIVSYGACLYMLVHLHMPYYMCGIVLSALLVQLVCIFINVWWKISVHAAGAGALVGALMAYSILFMFNPVWWLCLMILLSGAVGSARMLLRQHSLWQVLAGTLVGVACGFSGILLA